MRLIKGILILFSELTMYAMLLIVLLTIALGVIRVIE